MEVAFRHSTSSDVVRNRNVRCRILYIVGQLGAGGSERQLYVLLKSMDRDVYLPHVVVWNFNPDDTYLSKIRKIGVPLHFFPSSLTAAGKMLAFRRMVLELSPEVIHSYSFYTNVAAWWAALGRKIIAVGAVRSSFTNDRRSCGLLLGNLCARWPSNQIFNNLAAAQRARKSLSPFAPRRIFVVRNRVDLQQFPKTPLSSNGQARILAVGSLAPYKRWDRLLRAAATLKEAGYDFLVEIVGDGPLRRSLERQVQDLALMDRVKFVGYTNDVSPCLSSSTFLAHTSDLEGCPNTVMEAMASGRPVVAMDAGDIPILVEDGKTGFVVRRGDETQFVERLVTLISHRELCRQMGEASRVKAEREFALDRLVEETTAAYRAAGWKNL